MRRATVGLIQSQVPGWYNCQAMGVENLSVKLAALPDRPGVYLFKDQGGRVIYIGKAKNLRNRVRSYFGRSHTTDQKTEVLCRKIVDVDYVLTDNELEALLLESQLVKKKKPQFNVNLKDDKSFLHIKITVSEDFPRVLLTRRIRNDGSRYYGPYLPASLARHTIKIINRHFLLRSCDIEIDGKLDRPCLEYFIKRCLGPCVAGLCSKDDYRRAVEEVILFLDGRSKELIRELTQKMLAASTREHFEAAAFYRDRIQMVRELGEKQKMALGGSDDADIFAYHRYGPRLALQLFTLRSGKVVGKREFFWEELAFFHPRQFLRDALQQYYLTSGYVPRTIYVPVEPEDQDLLVASLEKQIAGRSRVKKARIKVPKRGEKHDLLLLVERNAKIAFDSRFRLRRGGIHLLQGLQGELDLPKLPNRIEAFDISNLQGSSVVGSMVVCEGGQMLVRDYRRFKIRTVAGQNDFAAIHEVVKRRYKRVLDEKDKLPNLVLIDGGKGQLHQAYQALSSLGLEDLPLASIAKREEKIYVQGLEQPVLLEDTSETLHLVQQIRDEAHRFAVEYHRKRRSQREVTSELDAIPGVGEKLKRRLLRNLGSVTRIRQATVEELTPFVGAKLALRIRKQLGSGVG